MSRTAALFLLFLVLWSVGLSTRSITRPDEGRYAEIGREMAVSGDWITPHLNGIPYFEKPPLQYWATATAIKVLGPTPLAARLWTALMGLMGCLAVWHTGARLFGRRAGQMAALILASCLYYAALGHINTLDMGVAAWMTVSVCAFLQAQSEDRRWMLAAWAAAAAAMMSKGLIALVLPGGALVLYSLWRRDFSAWKRLELVPGLLLFLALTVPWFLLCSQLNAGFLQFFFIHEHFQRFTTTIHHRVEPFWYFIPIVLAGLLPWTGLLWRGLSKPLAEARSLLFSPQVFLALYALLVVVFFSISDSKLPSYILPAFPPLALLLGRELAKPETLPTHVLWFTLGWAGVLAFAAIVLGFPELAARWGIDSGVDADMVEAYRHFASWLMGASSVLILGAGVATRLTGRPLAATVALALASLVSVQALLLGTEALSDFTSSQRLAHDYADEFQKASHIYSVGTYDQTLDYAIQRTVVLVNFQDELAFGLSLKPQLAIPDMAHFTAIWQDELGARAIMSPATYEALARSGLPMRMIFQDSRRVIVARI
jgi:hypothetical protein